MSKFEGQIKLLGSRTRTAARISQISALNVSVITIRHRNTLSTHALSRIIRTISTTRGHQLSTAQETGRKNSNIFNSIRIGPHRYVGIAMPGIRVLNHSNHLLRHKDKLVGKRKAPWLTALTQRRTHGRIRNRGSRRRRRHNTMNYIRISAIINGRMRIGNRKTTKVRQQGE